MIFKVIHPGKKEISLYTTEQFEQAMGIQFLLTPLFESYESVQEWCHLQEVKGAVSTEEKWLGILYKKEILKSSPVEMTIKWIDKIIGYGGFLDKPLPAGAFVGEYIGLLKKRFYIFRRQISSDYSFLYAGSMTKRPAYAIDAEFHGNLTRFINHSDTPNCKPCAVWLDGFYRIIIVTNTEISAGSQLFYDYGEDYWKKRKNKY